MNLPPAVLTGIGCVTDKQQERSAGDHLHTAYSELLRGKNCLGCSSRCEFDAQGTRTTGNAVVIKVTLAYKELRIIRADFVTLARSEERRVGKECRAVWSWYKLK